MRVRTSSTAGSSAAAEGWPAERLGSVERNILRVALVELEGDDVPDEVAINEAVELAKRYASDEAARLVNGILGSIVTGEGGMNAEDSLKRAEELLERLEKARADLERVSGSENSEEAIAVLTELAEIAKQVEAELAKARREAETEMKKRLDVLLVERGLADSRSQAQALVLAGPRSRASRSPGRRWRTPPAVSVEQPPRFVSRGGEKLEHALTVLGVDVAGLDCLDVGASTGGFTDACSSAARRGWSQSTSATDSSICALRSDGRVTVLERTNARYLEPSSRSRRSSSSATSPSSASEPSCRRCSRSRSPAGRGSSWSSRNSRRGKRTCRGAASCAIRSCTAACCARSRRRRSGGAGNARRGRLGASWPEGKP